MTISMQGDLELPDYSSLKVNVCRSASSMFERVRGAGLEDVWINFEPQNHVY